METKKYTPEIKITSLNGQFRLMFHLAESEFPNHCGPVCIFVPATVDSMRLVFRQDLGLNNPVSVFLEVQNGDKRTDTLICTFPADSTISKLIYAKERTAIYRAFFDAWEQCQDTGQERIYITPGSLNTSKDKNRLKVVLEQAFMLLGMVAIVALVLIGISTLQPVKRSMASIAAAVEGSPESIAEEEVESVWDRLKREPPIPLSASQPSHQSPTELYMADSPESIAAQVELTRQTLMQMGINPGNPGDLGCLAP